MNKPFLYSCIKGFIFMLKSTKYNIDFIYCKKGKRIKFLLQTQNICLNGFNASICFQNYWTYYFFCSQERQFSTAKEICLDQGIFPQSKEIFHKKFYLIKEIFHKQRRFPQPRKFSKKIFT